MPGDPSTKHGFPTMDGSDLGQTIDDTFNELVDALDETIAIHAGGLFSARPTSTVGSPGKSGRHYLATDTGIVYLDTGTGWVALTDPIGHVSWWAGVGDPPGGTHLQADGRPILRADYPLYWSIIGDRHGAGNGTTTVNIPDLIERVALGRGLGRGRVATYPSDVGQTGGEERHTLTSGEMPAHGHGVTDPGHVHLAPDATGYFATYLTGSGVVYHDGAGEARPGSDRTDDATTGISIQSTGGGGAHNNLPPYLALTPIVRVA